MRDAHLAARRPSRTSGASSLATPARLHHGRWPTRSKTCSTCSASSPSSRCSTRATRSRSACAPTRARRRRSPRRRPTSGKLTVAGAPADRGHRQEHGREDPRAARDGQGRRSSRRCARSTRASVVALLRIQGLGPKAVRRLRAELGVRVDRRSARARSPSTRCAGSRASARSPRRSSRRRSRGSTRRAPVERTPISVALPLATRIVARLREVPGVTHAVVLRLAAPLLRDGRRRRHRRGREPSPRPVMDALVAMSVVERVLGRGESKTSVVTHRGTQVDLRVVAAHQLGAALLYFTGSKGHNIKLRQRALARGLTLNEYALSEIEGGQGRRERDRGADLRGARPALDPARAARGRGRDRGRRARRASRSRSADVIGDFHVHTTVSGDGALDARGGGRRRERARLPRARDHRPRRGHALGRRPRGAPRAARGAPRAAGRARRLAHAPPRRRAQHRPATASSTTTPSSARGFDWCLASVHDHFELDRAAQTRRVVDGDAGPDGAHDRPPLGAHDRRAPADRPRSRRDPRRGRGDRHGARGQRRACRASTCRSRRCAARAAATSPSC